MNKGQRVSVTMDIKNKDGDVISNMKNRKGSIIGPANDEASSYFIMFDGRTESEAITAKFVTKI